MSGHQSDENEDNDQLFIPLASENPDAWDDRALIDAYERAVNGIQQAHRNKTNSKGRSPAKDINLIEKNQTTPVNNPLDVPQGEKARKRRRTSSSERKSLALDFSLSTRQENTPELPLNDQVEFTLPVTSDPSNMRRQQTGTNATGTEPIPGMLVPPPPPALIGSVTSELEQLLLSWYEAGYRAGYYVGKHQNGNETN